MEVKFIDIGVIKTYENNPRQNTAAVEVCKSSIKRFGFRNPILLTQDNIIVCGHSRYLAAKKLGFKQVPSIYVEGLTDEEINAYRIVDNKTSEYASWDFEKLNEEVSKIKEMSDFDLEDFDLDFDIENPNYGEEKVQPRKVTKLYYVKIPFDNENKELIQKYCTAIGIDKIAKLILEKATQVNESMETL